MLRNFTIALLVAVVLKLAGIISLSWQMVFLMTLAAAAIATVAHIILALIAFAILALTR